jgi:hypothetical protein
MIFLDKKFCASEKCQNDCGRRMTDKEREQLYYTDCTLVVYEFYCENSKSEKFKKEAGE